MAKGQLVGVDELEKLFQAIASKDFNSAKAIASTIADVEARRGHHTAARRLRGSLISGPSAQPLKGEVLTTTNSAVTSALLKAVGHVSLDDAILDRRQRRELDRLAFEWEQRARLNKAGVQPRKKLLFSGPPGCGKSFCAKALGQRLHLPVYVVKFDSIIGAFLGQTALHLRELFRFAETTACLLLIDEIDAIGRKRGQGIDVGELDRIVISLLQELEHSTPLGLIVATSNLEEHLDSALLRRFESIIRFPKPSRVILKDFARKAAKEHHLNFPRLTLELIASSRSFSEAKLLIENEIRDTVLSSLQN